MKKPTLSCFLAILISTSVLQAQHTGHDEDHHQNAHQLKLGRVSFPNSGNAAAQKSFLTGLALLHSFEYDAAADSFRVAERHDPDFALAYWMEALTNSQIVWGLEDRAAALSALSHLGATSSARIAKAKTASERAFGAAVEAFYKEGQTPVRVRAFADSMRKWVSEMPNDPEAHAFAALAIIWQAYFLEGKAADSLHAEAVRDAQWVFDRNPQHPGAAHYIIHASDSPAGAARGLKAARAYSRLAPDAAHALHMPSHIFLPLGMWEDMVPSNERAWRATRAEVASHNSPLWENDWHSLTWLQYAYLQLGRWKDARALIDTAVTLTAEVKNLKNPADDPDAVYAVEDLAFRYGAETGDWSAFPSDTVAISLADTTISERARGSAISSLYQRGAVAALRGNPAAAQAAITALREVRPPLADRIQLIILMQQHDSAGVLALIEKMKPRLRPDRFTTMVPSFAINASEQLGNFLIAAGKPREAITVFREALADRPRRAASMLGLARAQMAAGDRASARETYAELAKMWRNADASVRGKMILTH